MNEIAVRDQCMIDLDSKKDLIKKMFAKDCSDDELEIFLYSCQRLGLDPRAKQIYAIKLQGKMTIQIGIDGLRLVAERTGQYAPGKETLYQYDKDGKLLSATAYVKKYAHGEWHEVPATAYLAEYASGQSTWRTKPHIMLGKCAESLALRKAFPMELSGTYSTEEMESAMEEEKKKMTKKTAIPLEESCGYTDDCAEIRADINKYNEMSATLWYMMRIEDPSLAQLAPAYMPVFLEACQRVRPDIDIKIFLEKWSKEPGKLIDGYNRWYEKEGREMIDKELAVAI